MPLNVPIYHDTIDDAILSIYSKQSKCMLKTSFGLIILINK